MSEESISAATQSKAPGAERWASLEEAGGGDGGSSSSGPAGRSGARPDLFWPPPGPGAALSPGTARGPAAHHAGEDSR